MKAAAQQPLCNGCALLSSKPCRKVNFCDGVHLGACVPELVMALTVSYLSTFRCATCTHTHRELRSELLPSHSESLRNPQ